MWLGVAVLSASAWAERGRATTQELSAQIEEIARQVESARNAIELVEKQYTLREESSDEAQRLQRFDGIHKYDLETGACRSWLAMLWNSGIGKT